jgi:hypothetical protein
MAIANYSVGGQAFSSPVPIGYSETQYRDLLASKLPNFSWGGIIGSVIEGATELLLGHAMGHAAPPGPLIQNPTPFPTVPAVIPPPPGTSVSFPNTGMPTEVFGPANYPHVPNRGGRWAYNKYGQLVWIKNRRMNVLNPRALKRSMRRVEGFAKFAKRTISFTKKVKMKKRRKG